MLDKQKLSDVVNSFVSLAEIESPARNEREVADWCIKYFQDLGLTVDEDNAAVDIPGSAGCGNLYVRLKPTASGTPIFFCAHLDTVALSDKLQPVVADHDGVLVVTNKCDTILGADNKSAVAVMLELVRDIVENDVPHAGIELILTPCEEIGLLGAKAFDASKLEAKYGFVFDHANDIGKIVVSAPTQISFKAKFSGVPAHSGIEPENGRSAIRAAAEAISMMPHGRIDDKTTTNVGLIDGGNAVNIVPEFCVLHGEVRSLEHEHCASVMEKVIASFNNAAAKHSVDLEFMQREEYRAYSFTANTPVVAHAISALTNAGYTPELVPCGGGSDANVFNRSGIPCVNLPNGMKKIHTSDEYIEIRDLDMMLKVSQELVSLALS